MYDIPVTIIVYRRLEKTKEMFERVRLIKPQKLFIISDGPKTKEDEEKVKKVREYLDGSIDWDCEVHKRYYEENRGLRYGIPTGLSWVFENVDMSVILEDDVVCEPSFFHYAREMLLKYKDREDILLVSGFNPYMKEDLFTDDIALSYFASIWGWATWKRAFKLYENNIPEWDRVCHKRRINTNLNANSQRYFSVIFDDLKYHWYNSWGYQWQYTMFRKGMGIIPRYNMIKNIGINDIDAEHGGDSQKKAALINNAATDGSLSTVNIPDEIQYSRAYDDRIQRDLEKTGVLKFLKYRLRAKINGFSLSIIRKLEKDDYYFDNILPDRFKLNEEESRFNNGDRYRQVSAETLRFSARAYIVYKLFRKNLWLKGRENE